ncbi:MAG: alpha-E domain-containing protein, partial [Deltaproteobacteria bacterium]
PVDVILRRLDDDLCDPLALRPDSLFGVPGLVQAVQSGNVAVANALGTGLLETPGFPAFLPGLCRRLLGEDLLLPSAATWWCGDGRACDHVVENLADLLIKPAHAGIRFEPVFGGELTAQERGELAARIRARPDDYVAQERLTLSTTPAFIGKRLQPRRFVLRTYLVAHHDSFVMLPGGLTGFSGAAEPKVAAMQRGGIKDTWVLAEGPVGPIGLSPPSGTPVVLSRGGKDLPSRVAENLFRLGRCAERAEGLARLLRGVLVRLTETSGLAEAPELPMLLRAVTFVSDSRPGFVGEGSAARLAAPEAELLAMIYDRQRSGSVASLLAGLCPLAGTVRDRISRDLWRVANDLADFGQAPPSSAAGNGAAIVAATEAAGRLPTLSEALDQLDETVLRLAAFSGLATDSVTRGDGWRFLDLGRKLERALHTVSLLRHTLVIAAQPETPLLEALLEIADSSMTYRRRYQENVQPAAVIDLLLADEGNPRAVAFQLAAIAEHVERLPRDADATLRPPEQRLMMAALTAVRLADAERLTVTDEQNVRTGLEELLNEVGRALPAVSDAIAQTYLSR